MISHPVHHPEPIARDSPKDLTSRQLEIACLLVAGVCEREIAERLCLSAHTIHEHVRHIYERLGCRNRAQLAGRMLRSGACEAREMT